MKVREIMDFLRKEQVDFKFVGREEGDICSFSPLCALKERSVTWVKDLEKTPEEVIKRLNHTDGLLAIVASTSNMGLTCRRFLVEEPKTTFFMIMEHFFCGKRICEISRDSVVETNQIGSNVSVGHYCYINADVVIGDDVSIGHHVSIVSPCRIGRGSIIHSGVVIGTDGFGYYRRHGKYCKALHFGGVEIGEEVEIGANTCIDRGTMEDTVIGDRVKIDNLCHIGHNVRIGTDGIVVALSVLGGSCRLEKDVYIAPGAVVRNQVNVGAGALVGMGAVVTRDVEKKQVVAGVPARMIRENP